MKISRRANCDRYYLLKVRGYGVFLHRLHTPEAENVYHNHPWNAFSIVFGRYKEQKLNQMPVIKKFFNVIRAKIYHRIELPYGPVWTIFFHGKRFNRWQVVNNEGKVLSIEPWTNVFKPERKSYL